MVSSRLTQSSRFDAVHRMFQQRALTKHHFSLNFGKQLTTLRLGWNTKRVYIKACYIQGAPKNTLVHFLYYYAKSIDAIELKIFAMNINIFKKKFLNRNFFRWWRHHLPVPPPSLVTISHLSVWPPSPRWRHFWTAP